MAKKFITGQAVDVLDYSHAELIQLADILATTITWIAGSAGSPLSVSDAQVLLARIDKLKK